MNYRTIVTLPYEYRYSLKRLADQYGESVSALIREAVANLIDQKSVNASTLLLGRFGEIETKLEKGFTKNDKDLSKLVDQLAYGKA